MEQNTLTRGEKFIQKKKKWNRWRKLVTTMACVVVFCTTYALILPAITMEQKVYCGKEEHVKHSEDEGCYTISEKLVCKKNETDGHKHGKKCYDVIDSLICGKDTDGGHQHSEKCYKVIKEQTCGLEESRGHNHDDSCYDEEGNLICGTEESDGHSHTDACYSVREELTCGKEEAEPHEHTSKCYKKEKVLICNEKEEKAHTHKASCFKESKELTCKKEIHKHTKACYSNPKADLESRHTWEKTMRKVELTGEWDKDVLAVADSQLGYAESTRNYVVDPNGRTRGYTRYGEWYGDRYGHWCAMFVSYCLHYAEVDPKLIPLNSNCQNWIDTLSEKKYDLYRDNEEYLPKPGDLIFFDWNSYSKESARHSDHIGLVYEIKMDKKGKPAYIKTIEGNSSNRVEYVTYEIDDDRIMGYGELPENPDLKKDSADETEVSESETSKKSEAEETVTDETVSESADESVTEAIASDETIDETETVSESDDESESEKESESELESEIESESEPESESDSEFEYDIESELVNEPDIELESELESESETIEERVEKTAEYDDYTVTVSYPIDMEIPEEVILSAEKADDEEDLEKVSTFLDQKYLYKDISVFDIKLILGEEEYQVPDLARVTITMKTPEADKPDGLKDNEAEEEHEESLLLMLGEEVDKLPMTAEYEGDTVQYHYAQEGLSKVALVNGVNEQYTLTAEGDDYQVVVTYTDEAGLPGTVQLEVEEILGEEFDAKCQEVLECTEAENIRDMRIFDIRFLADGIEYEPEAAVQVQIIRQDVEELEEDSQSGIVHFGKEGTEVIESELTTTEDGTVVIGFESDEFSSYAAYVSDPFKRPAEYGRPATIPTVDTRAIGLTINMFDYWGDEPPWTNNSVNDHLDDQWCENEKWYRDKHDGHSHNIGVNRANGSNVDINSYLYFSHSGPSFTESGNKETLNEFTGANHGYGGACRQGIVKNTLDTSGYPVLATDANKSLSYLFSLQDSDYKRVDADVNHLFIDSNDGYIRYNSNLNYAYLDRSSKNFKVYGGTFNNEDGSKIGFWPYNEYDRSKTCVKGAEAGTRPYVQNAYGDWVQDDHVHSAKYYNHHFGMNMSGEFIIPPEKKVEGKDMTFEFSGDDDMWVFIDGVLVLDIGGIHEPAHGVINFTQGTISIDNAEPCKGGASDTMGTSNTLKNLFTKAGKTWNDEVDSEHRIDVFYLERGGCYSNLDITMNLQLFKKIPIKVTKKVDGEFSDEAKQKEFTLQIMLEDCTGSGTYHPFVGTLDLQGSDRKITTDENGFFTIRAGETWVTELPYINTKTYYVNEYGLDDSEFELAMFEDAPLMPKDQVQNTFNEIGSGDIAEMIDEDGSTITNVIKVERTKLDVNKTWYDGADKHNNHTVKFKVKQTDGKTGEVKELNYKGHTEFELNAANGWSTSFTDLPKRSLEHDFSYSVEEIGIYDSSGKEVEGYKPAYSDPIVKERLSIKREWPDSNSGNHSSDSFTYAIYRKVDGGSEELVQQVDLNSSNSWTFVLNDLDKEVDGHKYEYNVREISDPDNESYLRIEESTTTSLAIDNQPDYKINVEKQWFENGETRPLEGDQILNKPDIQVQLYRKYDIPAIREESHKVTFSVRTYADNTWTPHVASMNLSYQVKHDGKITFITKYNNNQSNRITTVSLSDNGHGSVSPNTTNNTDPNQWFTVSNITGDVDVVISIAGNIWDSHIPTLRANFKESHDTPQLLPGGSYEETVGNPVTLQLSNEWKYGWEGVETPAKSPEGYDYKYYLKEISIDGETVEDNKTEFYTVEYENNNGITKGTIIVKNTHIPTYELPEAGGIGTNKFTIGGGVIMILSLLLGIGLRRRRERRLR